MSSRNERSYPWVLWPFVALWDLLAFILRLTGRLLGAILGFALMVIGILLSSTVVASPVGIPLIILGFLLMLRSMF